MLNGTPCCVVLYLEKFRDDEAYRRFAREIIGMTGIPKEQASLEAVGEGARLTICTGLLTEADSWFDGAAHEAIGRVELTTGLEVDAVALDCPKRRS